MIEKFLEYLSQEKRYSQNTILSYRKDLEVASDFFLDKVISVKIEDAEKQHIRDLLANLAKNDLTKRSINRKISSLRSFYKFLLKIGAREQSPMDSIKTIKFYPEKQVPFSQEEMLNVTQSPQYLGEDPLAKILIETLYQTGIRRSELCNLRLEHVDFGNCRIQVTGKGNKTRLIPISNELLEEFQQYSKTRKPIDGNEHFFFINKNGKKLNEKFVYNRIKSYFSTVTTKLKRSPHMLRHTFATHVLENGAEISKLKSVLGHASLASTQVYTDADIEQLKKVFNKAHPRAKENKQDN